MLSDHEAPSRLAGLADDAERHLGLQQGARSRKRRFWRLRQLHTALRINGKLIRAAPGFFRAGAHEFRVFRSLRHASPATVRAVRDVVKAFNCLIALMVVLSAIAIATRSYVLLVLYLVAAVIFTAINLALEVQLRRII